MLGLLAGVCATSFHDQLRVELWLVGNGNQFVADCESMIGKQLVDVCQPFVACYVNGILLGEEGVCGS